MPFSKWNSLMKPEPKIRPWRAVYAVCSDGTRESMRCVNAVHDFLQRAAELKAIDHCWLNDLLKSGEPFPEALRDSPYSRIDLLYLRALKPPRIGRKEFHQVVSAITSAEYGSRIMVSRIPESKTHLFPDIWHVFDRTLMEEHN